MGRTTGDLLLHNTETPLSFIVSSLLTPYTHHVMAFLSTSNLSSLASGSAKSRILAQSDNDVVIVTAVRSAITKVSFSFCLVARCQISSLNLDIYLACCHVLNFTDTSVTSRARKVVSRTLDRKRFSPRSSRLLTPKPDLTPNSLKMSLSEMFFPRAEVLLRHAWPPLLPEFLTLLPSTR